MSESIYIFVNVCFGVLVEFQKIIIGINSLFGIVIILFDDFFYFDVLFWQDWNSILVNFELGIDGLDYDFLYFFVLMSVVLSEKFNFGVNFVFFFLKLKGVYVEVGNGVLFYLFGNIFMLQVVFGVILVFIINCIVVDLDLINECICVIEVGVDVWFLNDCLCLDVIYYNMFSFDQVIILFVVVISGYDFSFINGGEICNEGIELMLSVILVKCCNFSWDVMLNVGYNCVIVESLLDIIISGCYSIIVDVFFGDEGGVDLEYVVEEGELFGQFYGFGFQWVEGGQYDGQIIYENGLLLFIEEKVFVGFFQLDVCIGVYNILNFGNISFGFLFDGQIGGNIYFCIYVFMNIGGIIINEDDLYFDLFIIEGCMVYSVDYDVNGVFVYIFE